MAAPQRTYVLHLYYIGLDVHKKTISYCVKDVSGQVHQEGKIGTTRRELDLWIKTLPQPWTVAMEATIFTGRTYDHPLRLGGDCRNTTGRCFCASARTATKMNLRGILSGAATEAVL